MRVRLSTTTCFVLYFIYFIYLCGYFLFFPLDHKLTLRKKVHYYPLNSVVCGSIPYNSRLLKTHRSCLVIMLILTEIYRQEDRKQRQRILSELCGGHQGQCDRGLLSKYRFSYLTRISFYVFRSLQISGQEICKPSNQCN